MSSEGVLQGLSSQLHHKAPTGSRGQAEPKAVKKLHFVGTTPNDVGANH